MSELHGLNDVVGTIDIDNVTPTITPIAETTGFNFSVTFDVYMYNADGIPVTPEVLNLCEVNPTNDERLRYMRFMLAKLNPPPDNVGEQTNTWFTYTSGERTPANCTLEDYDAGDNYATYTYEFDYVLDSDAEVAGASFYDDTLTTRLAFYISGAADMPVTNETYDFVPDEGEGSGSRDIVDTDTCNTCHDPLAFHGGSRRTVYMCDVCHNPSIEDGAPEAADFNFPIMIHKIHAASDDVSGEDFSEITYPQSLANCRKCHQEADDADVWFEVQNGITCFGSCHGVPAGVFPAVAHNANTVNCDICHDPGSPSYIQVPLDVAAYHTTPNFSANNPELLEGERKIEYELNSAEITEENNLVIDFNIYSDGVAMDLTTLPEDLTGGPSFLMAYALPQDGMDAPADFNNLGNNSAQPTSQSLASLRDAGAIACNGTCTATLVNPFPDGAMMRTVGLQGYFTQTDVSALHTQSVVVTVTGDTARRAVADTVGCSDCHEFFEGHGGNRVFKAEGGVQICVLCHVPNLSSSGKTFDIDAFNATPEADRNENSVLAVEMFGPDPLQWPEATNNFKDMIHGIHSSAFRTEPYEFVRVRSGNAYPFDWSEVTFPGEINNCVKCHINRSFVCGIDSRGRDIPCPDTYMPENIPAGALVSTDITTNGVDPQTRDEVLAARASVPNETDMVISPVSAACYACHTDTEATYHMDQSGGAYGERTDVIDE